MKTKILLLTWAGVSFILASVCPAHAQHWTPLTSPSADWQSIASSANGIKLVAAVIEGPIYTSTNSGITWTLTSAPINRWAGVASSADGTRLVAVAESPEPLVIRPYPEFGAYLHLGRFGSHMDASQRTDQRLGGGGVLGG